MAKQKSDLLQGTLDMLILKTLALEPMHGWGISQRIQQISNGVLSINQGSLYPALYRLEQQGWITAEWGSSENNRQAKFYALTRTGRSSRSSKPAHRRDRKLGEAFDGNQSDIGERLARDPVVRVELRVESNQLDWSIDLGTAGVLLNV